MAAAGTKAKNAAEIVSGLLKDFGNTVNEIFADPELMEKTKDYAQALVDAAAKTAGDKVKDEEMRSRLRNVGKAARVLGEKLEKHFQES
jgi:hypothetical protein